MENEELSDAARQLLPLAKTYASKRAAAIGKELGSGGSASVFLLQRSDRKTALKVYAPQFLDGKNGPAERRRIDLQRQLIGHNCPTLIGITEITIEDGTCFIEMEYVDWQSLKSIISETPADKVESLFCQLIEAVQYLENRKLVHRDIKPENILVDPSFEHLKLIDFGVMREADGEDTDGATDHGLRRPFIASAQYSSPEYLFRLKEPSPDMWKALTIYQMGGVLHDLLMKKPLFDEAVKAENKFTLAMAVLTQVPRLEGIPSTLRPWAVIAANCLVKDPELRLALVDLMQMRPRMESGQARLEQIRERRDAQRNAQDAKARLETQTKQSRTQTLEVLQSGVRQGLIALIQTTYGMVVNRNDDQCIKFELAMDNSATLQIDCHFEWYAPLTPLIANVMLTANLGPAPHDTPLTRKVVGQLAAGPQADPQFIATVLDEICHVIAATAEHLALKDAGDDSSQFIDVVSLLKPA